ncbi:MAG: YggT family protein [Armatimonadetes bacterium]|nr:YggT family protein [Armatimonadota bacterium]NIM23339.1 YggT family protein [Armatimonadota bacterium]NIM67203.1 YggT family protein [Armatimonadota bacterium]NIM75728.1 YggT family protein [Armatimonadota bacterium]NIN05392.1 YggT family protein [Armatimonadota bacterium]
MEIKNLIFVLFRAAQFLIIARVIVSWIPKLRYHAVGRWLVQTVDPFLKPLRRLLPPWKTGGLDFSPLFALILLDILRELILRAF